MEPLDIFMFILLSVYYITSYISLIYYCEDFNRNDCILAIIPFWHWVRLVIEFHKSI